MRPLILMAAMIGTAASAQACPTQADLDRGIRFGVDGDSTEVFTRGEGPGIVTSIFTNGAGERTQSLLAQGVYLLEARSLEEGDAWRSAYAFEINADEMPLPVPGGQASFTVIFSGDGSFSQERQVFRFGPATQTQIGACRYGMIPVEVEYGSDEGLTDVLHYLPDLGLSLFVESRYDGGVDTYDYNSVEAVE
ncbi:hypothetical protein [Ponticoccus sp. (in: a-proteobacteria)]|uniref:hypothetical protein n=1 Tax=Ponticoccus sp. (in: a-proteobacteria) TaxID=1925025 RepID=UPI003AB1C8DE